MTVLVSNFIRKNGSSAYATSAGSYQLKTTSNTINPWMQIQDF